MSFIDLSLWVGYILVAFSALAAIVLPLIQSFSDPKSLIKSGIGIGALVLVFIIAYAISSGDAPGATESTSKMVGAGLISTYVFIFGALGGIVYTEISKMIK